MVVLNCIPTCFLFQLVVACKDEYTKLSDGSCVRMTSQALTWQKSEEDCKEKGGHLITINNKCNNDLVMEYVKKNLSSAGEGRHL